MSEKNDKLFGLLLCFSDRTNKRKDKSRILPFVDDGPIAEAFKTLVNEITEQLMDDYILVGLAIMEIKPDD